MNRVTQRRFDPDVRYFLATVALFMTCSASAGDQKQKNEIDGVWLSVSGFGVGLPPDKMTPAAKQAIAEFEETYGPDVPEAGAYCVHSGMPLMMIAAAGYPLEIISNQKQINISVETGSLRRIFMDGRPHPTDRPATSVGHSVGRWDGDVLIVETTGLAERVNFPVLSDQARIIERIYFRADTGERRAAFAENMDIERSGKMLIDEITVIDPKFYSEPIKLLGEFRRGPDTAVLEYDCGREFWEAALEERLKEKQAKK